LTGKGEKSKRARRVRLWSFDPTAFQPGQLAGLAGRLRARLRSLAKLGLYTLLFAYPILLVSLGLLYGGLVFWGTLLGSVAVMWLVIRASGYARNFGGPGPGNRRFLAAIAALGLVLVFFYSFINLRLFFLPVFLGALIVAFLAGMRRFS